MISQEIQDFLTENTPCTIAVLRELFCSKPEWLAYSRLAVSLLNQNHTETEIAETVLLLLTRGVITVSENNNQSQNQRPTADLLIMVK